jgi:hypothetical protein
MSYQLVVAAKMQGVSSSRFSPLSTLFFISSFRVKADDEAWAAFTAAAEEQIAKLDAKLATLAAERGIPEAFHPSISWCLEGRSENNRKERRDELRKVAGAVGLAETGIRGSPDVGLFVRGCSAGAGPTFGVAARASVWRCIRVVGTCQVPYGAVSASVARRPYPIAVVSGLTH